MSSKESLKISTPTRKITDNTTSQVQHLQQLKHQRSFEQRYASIINQQILETTINREALKRQMNVFLPLGRSASSEDRSCNGSGEEKIEVDEQGKAQELRKQNNPEGEAQEQQNEPKREAQQQGQIQQLKQEIKQSEQEHNAQEDLTTNAEQDSEET